MNTPSKRITLTETMYVIQGNYSGVWEDETQSTDYKEAKEDLKSYRQNSQYPSRLIRRRVLKDFSREFLLSLPTLHVGHFDNIKLESKKYRILVSRLTKADGARVDNEVIILKLNSSYNWVEINKY
jgi:hypothetical protein